MTLVFVALGCRTTLVTNRQQVLFIPEDQEIQMGLSAYEETLGEHPPSQNQEYIDLVNRVGQRIAAVADRPNYDWEFRVVASEAPNAFALPGGKVAVNEGILPIFQNEAGLAVVMAHEVAHALARHGGERMSQGMLVNGASKALSYLTRQQQVERQKQLMQAFGVASKYGFSLPYSRKHELEADHIGIMLMARAGYDPTEAPVFWERFYQINTSGASGHVRKFHGYHHITVRPRVASFAIAPRGARPPDGWT